MSEPDGKPHWTYASDTKHILDEWTEDGIAENYGDEAQGWLLAAAPALLAACQALVETAPDYWIEDYWGLYEEARAAIAAALPPEPCQGPDMSYLDAPCESEAEKP